MKISHEESLRDRFVRHVFGIVGPMDEHARQEVGRISTTILAILWVIQLVGLLIATWVSEIAGDANAFLALTAVVLLSLLGLVGIYGSHAMNKAQLTQTETTPDAYRALRRKKIHQTTRSAIISTIIMTALNLLWAGNTTIQENLATLFTYDQLMQSVIFGVGIFIVLYWTNVHSIRIVEE